MCLYPKLIRNRKYLPNKKNGGQVPPVFYTEGFDRRVLKVPVGCGKCIECMTQKSREWQIRLLEDVRHNKNGKFLTLTFSNESIKKLIEDIAKEENTTEWEQFNKGYELDNQIATLATRRFLERWRKEHKKSLRHWFVTELGHNGTENIHIHGIAWTDKDIDEIRKHWQYGYMWPREKNQPNYVTETTVNYITKYISKQDLTHKEYKPKILTSAGIGGKYIERGDANKNKYDGEKTKETYTTRSGHRMSLPIYMRNKIYTDEEREKLWIQKLDKQERYICGERIDISKGEQEYYELLEYYRQKNKRLGYGDDKSNWSQKEYESERRSLKISERFTNAENPLRGGFPSD